MQRLDPDGGDPSGGHWSVPQGAAQGQLIRKGESHQRSATVFHTLTGLPGERERQRRTRGVETTLEPCPVTVHESSKVKLAELWERGERHHSLPGPAPPAGEWQRINKAPRPPATESRGSVLLHPPDQPHPLLN